MNAWKVLAAVGVVGASMWVTVGARAQPPEYSGGEDYQSYCVSCHGADARGGGVVAKSLKKRPADLTQLTKSNSGVFPRARVIKTIDGREPGGSHGAKDMPIWGDVLAKSALSTGDVHAAARIAVLVKYLETLQAK